MIKNIVFDIGNVLVGFDWKPFMESFGFTEEVLKRVANATVHAPIWNEIDRGKLSEEEILSEFIKNDPEMEAPIRQFYENFDGMLNMYEYTRGLIKDLQNKGFKVYCLSNMSYKAVRECWKDLCFIEELDGYVLSCDYKLTKPEKEIYETLFKKYSLNPEECIFVDDLPSNIEGAKALGMKGVVFKNLKQAVSEIENIVKEEAANTPFTSKYTKSQRIASLTCVCLILLMYVASLVFSLLKFDCAKTMVKISLAATIVLPCLAWCYIWMVGKLKHKETIADFNFFKK